MQNKYRDSQIKIANCKIIDKMTTMRFIATCLMVILCFGFSSCSSEEDSPEFNSDVKKRLIRVDYKDNSETTAYLKFEYKENKVIKMITRYTYTGYDITSTSSFSYSGNSATVVHHYKGGYSDIPENYILTANCTLNKKGYITFEKYDEDDTWTYEYSNDYLVKATPSDRGYHGQIDNYTYNNGVMTSNRIFDEIKYTTYQNVGGLFLTYDNDILEFHYELYLYAGLLGNVSKYLPQEAHTEDEGDVYKYDYEFDKDGYVTKTTIICEGYPQLGWTETYTYETIE